jgi:hypothetical protein
MAKSHYTSKSVETICGYTTLPCPHCSVRGWCPRTLHPHFGNSNVTLNRNPHSGPPLGPST